MRRRHLFALFLGSALMAGCAEPIDSPDGNDIGYSILGKYPRMEPDIQRQLVALREMTGPYRDLNAAIDAGFSIDISGCVEDPAVGGMGYHYANVGRIDGAPPVLDQPEAMVFSHDADGRLVLGAVEYIIPFAAWTDPAPPHLLGMDFHPNPVIGVWMLHVWLWRYNPAGLMTDFNPQIHCP